MTDVKQKLADIFNDIPLDGSNIRDEEDDDNGYSFSEGDSSVSFEDKVSALSLKMDSAPPAKTIALLATVTTEPAVKATAEAITPAATPVVLTVPKIEVKVLVTEPEPHPAMPILFAEADAEARIKLKEAAPELERKLVAALTSKAEMAEARANDKGLKNTAESLMSTGEKDDEGGIEKESKSEGAKPDELDSSTDEDEVLDWGISDGMIQWKLTAPQPNAKELYQRKRHALSYILPGGQLPFDALNAELITAHVPPHVACNNSAVLWDKMQEVQGWRNRVVAIRLQIEEQYFMWKRHMEMFRGTAGNVERAKGAAVDAAAQKHLPDFEYYWGRLEQLVKSADLVTKNLEGAYETLSRQVGMWLENRRSSHDGSRFDPRVFEQARMADQNTEKPELQSFDSLDAPPIKTVGKVDMGDWEHIK